MKHILLIAMTTLLTVNICANNEVSTNENENENKTDSIMGTQCYRLGNTYFVDGQKMHSGGFDQYMETHATPTLATQFHSARKVSIAGWALLGAGTPLAIAGTWITFSTPSSQTKQCFGQALANGFWDTFFGTAMMLTGYGAQVASFVCLGVGYSRMHNTADQYISTSNREPQAYWSIQSSPNGIGVAYNF